MIEMLQEIAGGGICTSCGRFTSFSIFLPAADAAGIYAGSDKIYHHDMFVYIYPHEQQY